MFTTSADILNLALAIGFGLIAIFICMVCYQLIFILRDVSETTKAVKHAAQQIDELVVQPTKMISFLFERIRDIFGAVDIAGFLNSRRAESGRKKR